MFKEGEWGDLQRGYHLGITNAHHFYTHRILLALSEINHRFEESSSRHLLKLLFTSQLINLSLMNRYRPGVSFPYNPMSGTLYVGSQISESNPFVAYRNKIKKIMQAKQYFNPLHPVALTTQSTTDIGKALPANSIDYIFVDPPFGDNLPYSELSFLWESWIRVFTNISDEAIISPIQHKGLYEYEGLMKRCFLSMYRCLKPGRWMTVEFHNSRNSVWGAIQESIQVSGFVIADVRVLDKGTKTKKQITGTNAVKQDLIISCYKPISNFEYRFKQIKGEPEGAVEFTRNHLAMLPVAPMTSDGRLEVVAERTRFLLFDRMVAYHLQQGARIPLSASEFYQMLSSEFAERDGMYFLPDQLARYDALRSRSEVEQLSIFMRDERSAVQWVRTELLQSPQTLGDLTPKFMQEIRDWESHEPRPELRDLLKENFIVDDGGKWRVPDPNQERDLEALRRKSMLRTFEGYVKLKGQLKTFRKEAIIEGFKHCWQTKQLGIIVAICERIPAKVLQEIPEFVQFYDIAKDLAPAETQQLEFTWEG